MRVLVKFLVGLSLVGLPGLLLVQANAMGHIDEQKPPVLYRMQQDDKNIEDSASPLGYWEQLVSYPVIAGSSPSTDRINKAIKTQAYQFSCGSLGDYTFTATVHSIDRAILSISYEAMWLCPQMPAPDSDTGALVFNVITGKPIKLNDEFASAGKFDSFARDITEKLGQLVSEKNKSNQMDCEIPSIYSFYYKKNDALVFVSSPDIHSDSACAVEVEIPFKDMSGDLKEGSLFLDP